jgi:hypothetical protein
MRMPVFILFIPTMLVKKLEANFYRVNNTKCQYFDIRFVPLYKKPKSLKNIFFRAYADSKLAFNSQKLEF